MYKSVFKILTISLLCSSSVYASKLEISPLSVELNNKEKMDSIDIKNQYKNVVIFQTELVRWEQENGYYNYQNGKVIPPKDILVKDDSLKDKIKVFPTNMVIKQDSNQTIRFKLNKRLDTDAQYRVLLHEQSTPNIQEGDVQFLTTISLPIYLNNNKIKDFKEDLEIKRVRENNQSLVKVKNNNNQTIKLIEYKIDGKSEVLGYYLLPQTTSYLLIEEEANQLVLNTDKGEFEFKLEK